MKIYIASLLIILSSCTYEFNIDDVEAKRKPVIFCMPNTLGDTTLIQVSQSMNVNNKGTNTSAKPDVTFKLNGVEKEIKYTEKATDLLPANSYYVLGKLKEGDKIDMEASYKIEYRNTAAFSIGQMGYDSKGRFIRQGNTVPHIIYR